VTVEPVQTRADEIFPEGCQWLIEVASGNPEPDFPEDCVKIVPCGGKVDLVVRDGVEIGWRCEFGHEHISAQYRTEPYPEEF
jgi:hypothetical protein